MTCCAPEYPISQLLTGGQISCRATRSAQLLKIPLCRISAGQKSLHYRITGIWDSKDSDLKLFQLFSLLLSVSRSLLPSFPQPPDWPSISVHLSFFFIKDSFCICPLRLSRCKQQTQCDRNFMGPTMNLHLVIDSTESMYCYITKGNSVRSHCSLVC